MRVAGRVTSHAATKIEQAAAASGRLCNERSVQGVNAEAITITQVTAVRRATIRKNLAANVDLSLLRTAVNYNKGVLPQKPSN
jgi:hypothetical protein